jgi:hypothetical protein
LVGVDPIFTKDLEEILVLQIAQSAHRLQVRAVVGRAPGEVDGAGLEKALHTVVPRLAVYICQVVLPTESLEGLTCSFGANFQIPVEQPELGSFVHIGGPGDDSIEIEDDCVDLGRVDL